MPSPLSCAAESRSRISELEIRREPPVVLWVALVTADTTEAGLAGGAVESVTERGTPLAQPCVAGAGAAAGAAVAAGAGAAAVVVAVIAAFSFLGHLLALCPGSPHLNQLNVPSALKYGVLP